MRHSLFSRIDRDGPPPSPSSPNTPNLPPPMDITFGIRRSRRLPHATADRRTPPDRSPRLHSGRQHAPTKSWTSADQRSGSAIALRSIPVWKRVLDLLLVALVSPIVLLIAAFAALWIRLVSPGPVLFRQTRIGKGGKPFTIYKFRSMHLQASTQTHTRHVESLIRDNAPLTKLDELGDSRLIRGAGFLRRSGIDELPQLVNVLRGDMSLVGPRPCLPDEFRWYRAVDLGRFAVEPGLTGLWQIKRHRLTTFREMLALDEEYAGARSPGRDFWIMVQTPIAVLVQWIECMKSKHLRACPAEVKSPLYGGFRDPVSDRPEAFDAHV